MLSCERVLNSPSVSFAGGAQARVVGNSTSSQPHPITSMPFLVDFLPPKDTRCLFLRMFSLFLLPLTFPV